jgi:hypothetical protein
MAVTTILCSLKDTGVGNIVKQERDVKQAAVVAHDRWPLLARIPDQRHCPRVRNTVHPSKARGFWSPLYRLTVFILAATSIWSLLIEFTGWWSMRGFTLFIALPSFAALCGLALVDRTIGTERLWRAALVGGAAGLLAAIAYDVFRLPFVYADALGIQQVVPALNLFKVFPRFGAMILGQPLEQPVYSATAQIVGWAYHFSNGLTFGIMYVALIGDAAKHHWAWGVVFAVGLELAMLLTPYPAFFEIPLTAKFVVVTLLAHLVFGVVMGLAAQALWSIGPARTR